MSRLFNKFRPLFRMLEGPLEGRFGTFEVLTRRSFNAPQFAVTLRDPLWMYLRTEINTS